MPRQDKTGPIGKGPKTGRGLGICNEDELQKLVGQTDLGTKESQERATEMATGIEFGARRGRGVKMGRGRGIGRGGW